MPFPSKWWKKARYVDDSEESTILAEFRSGYARLGNREAYSSARLQEFSDEDGRIVWCPACDYGDNNEHHVIIDCQMLSKKRKEVKIGNMPLSEYISDCRKKGIRSSEEILRHILFLTPAPFF